MTPKEQQAHDYFYGGYNCAQSVFTAFHEEMGISEALAFRLTAAMGGGVGGLREICGAVSGAALALSMLYGDFKPGDQEKKEQLYALVQSVAGKFKAQYTTINCAKLLELNDIKPSATPVKRDAKYYEDRPCGKYVEFCAKLVEEELHRS